MTDNEIIRLQAQQFPAASEVLAKAFENDQKNGCKPRPCRTALIVLG